MRAKRSVCPRPLPVLFSLLRHDSFNSRNAMDNASKNASDMISALQMKYNRGRQAAITNELVDIITGSSYYFSSFVLEASC